MKYDFTTDMTARFLPEEMGDYLIHRTQVTIIPKGDPLYSLRATVIEISDDAGGEYVKIRQQPDDSENDTVCVDAYDWPVLRTVIDAMVARCRTEGQED